MDTLSGIQIFTLSEFEGITHRDLFLGNLFFSSKASSHTVLHSNHEDPKKAALVTSQTLHFALGDWFRNRCLTCDGPIRKFPWESGFRTEKAETCPAAVRKYLTTPT